MSDSPFSETPEYVEEPLKSSPDRVSRILLWASIGVGCLIVAVLAYALLTGVFFHSTPRTWAESVRAAKESAVKANPGNGQAWADYAEALYAIGDKEGAQAALAQARTKVTDKTIREVNNVDLHFLILEGRNADALARSQWYLQRDTALRTEEYNANLQKGITVPTEAQNNDSTIRLFVLQGTAQSNLKMYKEAIESFNAALALDEQAADIIILRGWARVGAGDKTGAAKDFKYALQFLPDDASAKEGLKQAQSTDK